MGSHGPFSKIHKVSMLSRVYRVDTRQPTPWWVMGASSWWSLFDKRCSFVHIGLYTSTSPMECWWRTCQKGYIKWQSISHTVCISCTLMDNLVLILQDSAISDLISPLLWIRTCSLLSASTSYFLEWLIMPLIWVWIFQCANLMSILCFL